jgi:hypothetical protein
VKNQSDLSRLILPIGVVEGDRPFLFNPDRPIFPQQRLHYKASDRTMLFATLCLLDLLD